ncbi:6334_t:CDS:1, partial [Acaulospora colombiana]
ATEEEWKKYSEDGYFWSYRGKFSGSGKVLWHPTPLVGVPTPRSMKHNQTGYSEERTYGWLAMRQPPWVHRKPSWMPKKPQILNGRLLPMDDQVNIDVTEKVVKGQAFSILWDARWLLEFSE